MEFRRRLYFLGVFLAVLFLFTPAPTRARILLSQKEALVLAFPQGTVVERQTAFLTEAQLAQAQNAAGTKIDSRVWTYYVGKSTSGITGTAYFESHKVRTMNEAFMVVVNPDATIRFIEILSFAEPDEYLAPKGWLQQFQGKPLDENLMLHRGLRNITGASITSDVVTRAVRRILAVHRVLNASAAK